MKRSSDLEAVIKYIKTYYNMGNNKLIVSNSLKFSIDKPELGNSYEFYDDASGCNVYVINTIDTDSKRTNLRILAHEAGHIYCGHFSEIHEELDARVKYILEQHRAELVDQLNESLGIDFADKLLEKVIYDEEVNNMLHDIAMDMEVNSKILDKETIEELAGDVESLFPPKEDETLRNMIKKNIESKGLSSEDLELMNREVDDALNKMKNKSYLHLIGPWLYKDHATGQPFEDGLSYPTYLMKIIENLDQFIKMLAAMNKQGNGNGNGQGDGNGSGQGNLDPQSVSKEDISNLLNSLGSDALSQMINQAVGNSGNGSSSENDSDSHGEGKNHSSDSRSEANKDREDSGNDYCKSKGTVGGVRGYQETRKDLDKVDMALKEVLKESKHKVISYNTKKDLTYFYNRGINRGVLAPRYKRSISVNTKPKLVFLIDVSGSMNIDLVNRIVGTIARSIKRFNRDLRYDIIAWDTDLCHHYKDIDPSKSIPDIPYGGGTEMARGIKYFKDNYGPDNTLIVISDFYDDLDHWARIESTMSKYSIWGFQYGNSSDNSRYFKNLKYRKF